MNRKQTEIRLIENPARTVEEGIKRRLRGYFGITDFNKLEIKDDKIRGHKVPEGLLMVINDYRDRRRKYIF